MSQEFLHEPLQFTSAKPVRLAKTPFRDLNIPRAYLRIGMKRSGKGVTMDKDIYIFWKNYITCLLLHSAGGGENLYSIVNKNCQTKFDNIKAIVKLFIDAEKPSLSKSYLYKSLPIDKTHIDLYLGLMKNSHFIEYDQDSVSMKTLGYDLYNGKMLHCECRGTIPIIWMIPDWVKPREFTFDWFNGYYFKDWHEYNDAYVHCKVNEFLPESYFTHPDYKKKPIKKPKSMIERIKPLIITRSFTTPTTDGRSEVFREQFRKMVLEARDQHRLLVNSPFIFPDTTSGRIEKYSTVARIVDFIPELVLKDFGLLKLDKPRDQWTEREKAWHKIAIFMGEIRELAPNSKLSPEKESNISKRSLYSFMPKSRHQHCFVHADLQSTDDMFGGVLEQNDFVFIKRSNLGLLGEKFGWFFKMIEEIRKNMVISRGFTMDSVPFDIIEQINKKLPSVDEIPDNKMYVIYPNHEFRLATVEMPMWHHKSDRDDLHTDTGLEWDILKDKTVEIAEEKGSKSQKVDRKLSKKLTDEDYALIDMMAKEGKSMEDIIKKMRENDKNAGIQVDRFAAKNEIKNLNNKLNDWRKKKFS